MTCKIASDAQVDSGSVLQWPDIWNTRDNNWLFARNGLLGCTVCRNPMTAGLFKTLRMNISAEWPHGIVSHNGATIRKQKLTSLRKKTHEHKYSDSRNACGKALSDATGDKLP